MTAAPRILLMGEPSLRTVARAVNIATLRTDPTVVRARQDTHAMLEAFRRANGFGRAMASPQVTRPVTTTGWTGSHP